MKNLFKRLLPVAVLALTLCMSICMLAACSNNNEKKDVVFTGDAEIGTLPVACTLKLKDDKTCEFTVVIDTDDTKFKDFEDVLKNTGTWEMDGEEYKVTLAKQGGDSPKAIPEQTITSTHSGSTYTISDYKMFTEFGPKPVTLTYTK